MKNLLDLDRFPIHQPQSDACNDLIRRCQADWACDGMFSLTAFLHPAVAQKAADELAAAMESESFTHSRRHNIYFKKSIPELPANHPALREYDTTNHTLCADQLRNSPITEVYEWAPLRNFLAATMKMPALYLMDDPLARVNVMSYGKGETLNWHFDRSQFTTTLLLQAPTNGGEFEYRYNLRDDTNPNYNGVAKLLAGDDPDTKSLKLTAGTLNVFQGKNTPHRVTPVGEGRKRVISVFSFYQQTGVRFSAEEQQGFYGRTLL